MNKKKLNPIIEFSNEKFNVVDFVIDLLALHKKIENKNIKEEASSTEASSSQNESYNK